MSSKPTYEELEQRVKELELEVIRSKGVEEGLRKSNELFEKTFIIQLNAIFILNPAFPPKIIDCNPAAAKSFGYTRQEMLGRTTAFLHVNEATLKKFQENVYPVIEDCGHCCLPEFEMKRKDGTVFPTEHSVFPLQNDKGIRVGWVSVVRDITERKRAEEALRESEGKLKAMLQSIGDHISMIDKDLNIIWANETAKSVFGKNIIGKKCYEAYHQRKESCEPYPCITLKAFQDGKIHEHKTKVIDKSGRKIFFHRTANIALTDKEGKPKTVIEISRDITEQRRAEKLLQKSHDNLERLIAQRTRDLEFKAKSLEEANTALKVLLKRREEDRTELEEKVLFNIKEPGYALDSSGYNM